MNGPWCGIEQMQGDDFDWTLIDKATGSQGTGPDQAQSGSQYIYIETSNPRKFNETAT